ncbi:FecCD family ABC transporter permease [Salinicoccus sp. HZC-1]|uniref:FecCD family ABC transporter permease n=1 Tax=Salinicoccus sp. HZC-1 TaxID=3385497 RepID=UPI00398BA322
MNKHILILLLVLIMTATSSVFVGSAALGALDAHQLGSIIFGIRIPRVLFAIVIGVALSVSGVVFQVVLRNPMADSFTLGMANGAVLGSAIVVVLPLPLYMQPVLSIVTGLLGLMVVLFAARRIDVQYRPETLIITGVLLGAMLSGVLYILVLIQPTQTESIARYMFGSLSGAAYGEVLLTGALTLIAGLVIHKYGRQLDLLNLGDVRAFSLGVKVGRLRLLLLVIASVPPLVAISFSGIIALAGIIVPQMILYFKPLLFRPLMILSALYGALYILIIDTIGRTVIAPVQIPTGVMVMLSAVPLFIFLMQKRMLTRKS